MPPQRFTFSDFQGVGINGSDRRLDGCAVCSGANSTCRLVSGIFTRPQLPMGYNLITQLPQAACNLTITELKQSRNYLGMWAPLSPYPCYLFNTSLKYRYGWNGGFRLHELIPKGSIVGYQLCKPTPLTDSTTYIIITVPKKYDFYPMFDLLAGKQQVHWKYYKFNDDCHWTNILRTL